MDPNSALANARATAQEILELDDSQDFDSLALELAERFAALDRWMTAGGFLPDDWKVAR